MALNVMPKFLEPDIKEALTKGNVVLDGLYSWYEYQYLIKTFSKLKIRFVLSLIKNYGMRGLVIEKKDRFER